MRDVLNLPQDGLLHKTITENTVAENIDVQIDPVGAHPMRDVLDLTQHEFLQYNPKN